MIREDILRNLQARGTTLEDYLEHSKQTKESWEKDVKEAAKNRVIGHIIVAKLGEELKIEVTDKEVEQQVAELQHVYAKSPEMLADLRTPEAVASIRNRIRVNKTMDKLADLNRK